MLDLLLKNCHVVTETESYNADIEVKDGKITGIVKSGSGRDSKKEINCENKTVIPGCIDTHVHFNEPGYEYREGFITGSRAAAVGGITLVADMPVANKPHVKSLKDLEIKKNAIKDKSYVDYSFWGGLVDNNLNDLEGLKNGGVLGLKAFTVDQLSDFKWINDGVMYDGFSKCSDLDLMVGLHCENNQIIEYRQNKIDDNKSYEDQIKDFLWVFDEETELTTVNNVIEIAKKTKARVHILHASLPETVKKVKKAKKENVNITVETCPHYLVMSNNDLFDKKAFAKCTPPLRDKEAVEGLWELIKNDDIYLISSDHSPSTIEEKSSKDSFWKAWGGIQGVQFMVQLLLSEGVNKRGLSLHKFVKLLSSNPARYLGQYPKKGTIQIGSEATFTIIDLDKKWEITKEDIVFKNKHTPYLNMKGKGLPEKTILRGEVIDPESKEFNGKFIG